MKWRKGLVFSFAEPVEKMREQAAECPRAVREAEEAQVNHVQSVIQVLAESPFFDERKEIHV